MSTNPFANAPFANNTPTHMQEIVKAARERFGDVMKVVLKEAAPHGEFYFVACKRTDAPVNDRPYMTITAKYDLEHRSTFGRVTFFWGHYDLSVDQIFSEIAKIAA